MRCTTERDVLEDLELIGVHTLESYYPGRKCSSKSKAKAKCKAVQIRQETVEN